MPNYVVLHLCYAIFSKHCDDAGEAIFLLSLAAVAAGDARLSVTMLIGAGGQAMATETRNENQPAVSLHCTADARPGDASAAVPLALHSSSSTLRNLLIE
jgi:hypothetical protein